MAHDTLLGACRHLCVEETWHQTSLHQYDPCFQAQQWQHRVVGMLFCNGVRRLVRTEGKIYIIPYWRSFCEEVGMSDSCEGLYSTRQWPQVKHIWSGLRPASFPERLKNRHLCSTPSSMSSSRWMTQTWNRRVQACMIIPKKNSHSCQVYFSNDFSEESD